MFRLKRAWLIHMVALTISNLAFGQLTEVATDSGTYRGHISPIDERVTVFGALVMQRHPWEIYDGSLHHQPFLSPVLEKRIV